MVTSIIKHPQASPASLRKLTFGEFLVEWDLAPKSFCLDQLFWYFHVFSPKLSDLYWWFVHWWGRVPGFAGGGRRDFNRSSSCCSPRWYINVPVHGQFVPGLACHTITFFFTVHNVMQTTAWGGRELDKTSSTNYDASVKSWIQRWECYGSSSSAVKQGKSPQTL